MSNWGEFRENNYQKIYEKIVYRNLKAERTDVFINKLGHFINSMLGQRAISVSEKERVEGVYCAELIGRAFQELGILSTECKVKGLMPGNKNEKKGFFKFLFFFHKTSPDQSIIDHHNPISLEY